MALAANGEMLLKLAKNPRTQKVITAYIISRGPAYSLPYDSSPDSEAEADTASAAWLKTAEAAGVRDMDSAEAFAIAAYRENDMVVAQRWIKRCRASSIAQWLQAKLLMRSGKLDEAAALWAKSLRFFRSQATLHRLFHSLIAAPVSL